MDLNEGWIEFKLYGATSDLQVIFGYMFDEERPYYAALDYLDRNGSSLVAFQGYGYYRCELARWGILPRDGEQPLHAPYAEQNERNGHDGEE
jgi:hypothetical protein